MRFEIVHGLPVALGVEWYDVSPNASERKKLLTTLRKSARATHTILVEQDGSSHYGVLTTRGQRKVPAKFASALAWFSLTRTLGEGPEAVVWVQGDASRSSDISNMRAWIGCTMHGFPMARGDRMVRLADVTSVLMEMYPDDFADTVVHVINFPEHGFSRLGEHYERFAELIETSANDLFPKEMPGDAVMSQTGLPPVAVKAIAASFILLTVGGAAGGYYYYEKVEEEKRLAEEARLRALAAAQPKPEEVYAQAFAGYFQSGQKRLPVADAARAAYASFKSIQMVERGWSFHDVTCSVRLPTGGTEAPNAVPQPMCQIEYKRKPESAPIPDAIKDYPTLEKQVETVKGRRPFDVTPVTLANPPQSSELVAQFAGNIAIDGLLRHLRQAKDHGMKVSFQLPAKLTPQGTSVAPVVGASNFEIKTGTFSIGGPMALFEMVYQLPSTAYLQSLRISEERDSLEFKVDGYYFVSEAVASKPALPAAQGPAVAQEPAAPVATQASAAPVVAANSQPAPDTPAAKPMPASATTKPVVKDQSPSQLVEVPAKPAVPDTKSPAEKPSTNAKPDTPRVVPPFATQ